MLTLYDLPPRERILSAGPSSLSDADLVGVLLGTGSHEAPVAELARRVLDQVGGLRALAECHPSQVMSLSGLGVAKAARVFAAVEVGRRVSGRSWELGERFSSSQQVFSHYHPLLRDHKRELFFAVFLDARNRLVGDAEISCGSLVASIVHPREVFRPAILAAAVSVICVHNHPSGDPTCSREDVAITRRLHEAGRTIGIEVIDHIIIGDGAYCSFVDQRLAPFEHRARDRGKPEVVDTSEKDVIFSHNV